MILRELLCHWCFLQPKCAIYQRLPILRIYIAKADWEKSNKTTKPVETFYSKTIMIDLARALTFRPQRQVVLNKLASIISDFSGEIPLVKSLSCDPFLSNVQRPEETGLSEKQVAVPFLLPFENDLKMSRNIKHNSVVTLFPSLV